MISKSLLAAYDALLRGKITAEQLIEMSSGDAELMRFLNSPDGRDWQIGREAGKNLDEAVADFERIMSGSGMLKTLREQLLAKGSSEEAVLDLLVRGFVHGYWESAQGWKVKSGDAGEKGREKNSEKASQRKKEILAAYDSTDPLLSEGQRYSIVSEKCGVCHQTIRNALDSR